MSPIKRMITVSISACLLLTALYTAPALSGETFDPRLPEYITTHFTATGGDEKPPRSLDDPGEREEGYFDPFEGRDADLRWMNYDKHGKPFNESVKPAYNNYHNETTAYNAIKIRYYDNDSSRPKNDHDFDGIPNEIEAFEHKVFSATGYHVDILNYDPYVPVESYLFEDHPNIQIVNNVIFGNSLFTVMFPPHWNKDNKYPVKMGGHGWGYDNNSMYRFGLTTDAEQAGLSVPPGSRGRGLIVVRSNAGGREAVGLHSNSMRDVGEFMEKVMSQYGADLTRVVTEGASRGGRVALAWGVNPYGYGYNTVAITAMVPPIKKVLDPMFTFPTFPAYPNSINKLLGSPLAHTPDYADQEQSPQHVLSHEEKYDAARLVLNESKELSEELSPYDFFLDETLLPLLRKKRIQVTQGSHDSFFSMAHLLSFDDLLTTLDIPHRIVIGYGYGHEFFDPLDDTENTLAKLVKGQEVTPYKGTERLFFMPGEIVNRGNGTEYGEAMQITDEVISRIRQTKGYEDYFPAEHDEDSLGFSVSIPYLVQEGGLFTVILMGEEGKSWEIFIRKENGYEPVFTRRGVFGETEPHAGSRYSDYGKEYAAFTLNADVEPGRYEWFFKYDGQEIPNRFTNHADPPDNSKTSPVSSKAVTEVTEGVPLNYLHPESTTWSSGFGVDQYHPLLLKENNAPVFTRIDDMEVRTGTDLRFRIKATDPDGDPLVYDIRNALDGKLLYCADEFNGATGEFFVKVKEKHIGPHYLRAIAKDGKGGVSEQVFAIYVTE